MKLFRKQWILIGLCFFLFGVVIVLRSILDPADVDDFASTKHKGLPNKVKRENKVRSLIRKMVREVMKEDFAGTYPKEIKISRSK